MHRLNALAYWLTREASFFSFMPTHIGAETDLRFVYCAGGLHYHLHLVCLQFYLCLK